MGIMKFEYYTQMFAKTFDFRGKSGLKEYWFAVLYNLIFSFCTILIAIPFVVDLQVFYNVSIAVSSLYEVVIFLPMLALTVRRLHDANHSARAFLWLLLPFVGEIIFIIYLASPSNSNLNLWPFSNNQNSNKTQNPENSSQTEPQAENLNVRDKTQKTNFQSVDEFKQEIEQDLKVENEHKQNFDNAENLQEKPQEQSIDIEPITIDENKVKIEDTNLSRSERIKTLQAMHENGEISDEEYHRKAIEILKR